MTYLKVSSRALCHNLGTSVSQDIVIPGKEDASC